MSDLTFIILTRFNILSGSNFTLGLDYDWLSNRFELFDSFCYPSVRNQTNQNFKWLVFFDSATPQLFRKKINLYAKWDVFTPCYVDFTNDNIINRIIAKTKESSDFLITSRLDNDDALSRDYVQTVLDNFRKQKRSFLNFNKGYVLDIENNSLYIYNHYSNAFITLIEKTEDFTTVFCDGISHIDLASEGRIEPIHMDPMWLQVVHSKNIKNKIKSGMRRVPINRLQDSFTLNYSIAPKHMECIDIFIENNMRRAKSIPSRIWKGVFRK